MFFLHFTFRKLDHQTNLGSHIIHLVSGNNVTITYCQGSCRYFPLENGQFRSHVISQSSLILCYFLVRLTFHSQSSWKCILHPQFLFFSGTDVVALIELWVFQGSEKKSRNLTCVYLCSKRKREDVWDVCERLWYKLLYLATVVIFPDTKQKLYILVVPGVNALKLNQHYNVGFVAASQSLTHSLI